MGKVTVPARVENLSDIALMEDGRITADQIRTVMIPDALVDTGATGLHLPKSIIATLGLKHRRDRTAMTAAGARTVRVFGRVLLTIQGRECPMDVSELPDECPALIGQVPLEVMDFIIDPRQQALIGNPAHGGEQVIEIY